MTSEVFMFNCAVCDQPYQHGTHLYEGRKLELYGGIFCCRPCWDGNWDGWGPRAEPRIVNILMQNALPIPNRNKSGWLPRA
jgi:hypothetical protein